MGHGLLLSELHAVIPSARADMTLSHDRFTRTWIDD